MAKIILNVRDDIKSNTGGCTEELYSAIQNGILLPTNCTNGDVIKALFPKAAYNKWAGIVDMEAELTSSIALENAFDIDWWNAHYKED